MRPLAVLTGACAVAALAIHRLPFGPAIATVLVVALVRPQAAALVALGFIAWVVVRRWGFLLRRWGDGTVPTAPLVVVAVLFLAVNIVTAAAVQGLPALPRAESVAAASEGRPSVFVVLLDGYPRQDTLLEDFGYDNEPFLAALEERGFAVDRESQARYSQTSLALAHLLGLDEAAAMGPPSHVESKHLRRQLAEAPAIATWGAAGYDVMIIRSAMSHVTIEGSLDTGQVDDFEVTLLGRSLLAPLVREWVLVQQRDRLDASLDSLAELAQSEGSKVVLAHVMAPHPPFLTLPTPACWPECGLWHDTGLSWDDEPDAYADAVHAQIDYLNPRVLAALDTLIDTDPDAAIILFSDHGFRHTPPGTPDRERNLYAVRGEPAIEIEVPAGATPDY